jgi:single-strand DNA-binding protein
MNNVSLVGRLTKDPDVRYTTNGLSIARINIAVDRQFKKEGQATADFIPCIAFGKTAEFVEKYFLKGQRIGLTGRIQTGSYEKEDGTKVYTTDIVIDNVEFVESKTNDNSQAQTGRRPEPSAAQGDGFMNIPDGMEDELPFN